LPPRVETLNLPHVARRPIIPVELTVDTFTLEEALRAGVSRRQLRGQSWRRVEHGIYRWSKLAESPLLELTAVIHRLPQAVFSGRTAAWLHGLDLPPTDPVEVTIPDSNASGRAGVKVQRASLVPSDVVRLKGLPATSGLRTALDLGRRAPLVDSVVALDMALHRGLASITELTSFVEANRGASGIATLRRAVSLAEPAAESPMESRLRLLLVRPGLRRPQAQVSLHDERGRFLGRPDLYYPGHRLGLEYDGGSHRDSLVEDNRRQNRLINAGYRLLRFTAADIFQTPDVVVAQVRMAISQGPDTHALRHDAQARR
jgi:hypothetical protein